MTTNKDCHQISFPMKSQGLQLSVSLDELTKILPTELGEEGCSTLILCLVSELLDKNAEGKPGEPPHFAYDLAFEIQELAREACDNL